MRTRTWMRRVVLGVVAAFVLAAGVITIAPAGVSAEKSVYTTEVGQNTFVKGCRKTGGKPSRVAARTVKYDHGDGSSTTCNFSTEPAKCTYVSAFTPQPTGTHVDPGTVAGAESGPKVRDRVGTERGTLTATLATDDEIGR